MYDLLDQQFQQKQAPEVACNMHMSGVHSNTVAADLLTSIPCCCFTINKGFCDGLTYYLIYLHLRSTGWDLLQQLYTCVHVRKYRVHPETVLVLP